MNQRIRPDDLDNSPYKETIQALAYEWVRVELPARSLTYTDYMTAIRTLLLTTQDPGRTATIIQAVLAQAIDLRKTAEWVEEELKFEGMIDGADRVDFLRFELQQAESVDDGMLDTYNDRINRFAKDNE
ncbi:hypothetical protein [Spirosoma luteum]|uniref:hypothetical protein n=1 Tax=Spirosoma luteum TaxID=431553 RepID=UPI00036159C8|nr:hypothetical protein [Spirosoma luteum]